MIAPLPNMKRDEILDLFKWRCKHGHNGISHYNCWIRESGHAEKVGFIDIETSNLAANFGIILSWAIKPAGKGKKIIYGVISKEDLTSGDLDKRVVADCINTMRKFNRLIGHYSSRFDLPFIRTRALYWDLDFPGYGEIIQEDVWDIARRVLKLHSNRQDVVADTLLGGTRKTRFDAKHWIMALQGDSGALKYILDHNKKDVLDLEQNYNKLTPFVRKGRRSI